LILDNDLEMKPDSTLTRQNGGAENGVNDSSSDPENKSSSRIGGLEVEWSEDHGRLSRMGGLSYFADYLEAAGLLEHLVGTCPLAYLSNNAPSKRDVLGEILLSVLEGQPRYAHMASLANAQLDAQTLGMEKIPSEDSIRTALKKLTGKDGTIDKSETQSWLRAMKPRAASGCHCCGNGWSEPRRRNGRSCTSRLRKCGHFTIPAGTMRIATMK